jgi:hypothetical protein
VVVGSGGVMWIEVGSKNQKTGRYSHTHTRAHKETPKKKNQKTKNKSITNE